jgi:porphobilinogen synthase
MNLPKEQLGLRRLRLNPLTRELVREVRLSHEQFIQPHFVVEGLKEREGVSGMTDVFRESCDSLMRQVEADLEQGVNKLLLFGVPAKKAESDFDFDFTAGQLAAIRKQFGADVWISADVCLCSATTHGHCGVINDMGDHILNTATVEQLARAAAAFAEAGADCVAPSDMMDGRIAAIRAALDAGHCERTLIMSYAAKFHSGLYGPFREAADSAPRGNVKLADRATYQIDPARPGDALAAAQRDAAEGADILMVKPGLPYLDVLAQLKNELPTCPWAAYEVSGEYAAIELLAQQGLADRARAHTEAWTSLARAGASIIISYGARHAKRWLSGAMT